MGARGPKPISTEQREEQLSRLWLSAYRWSDYLYALRYGEPGALVKKFKPRRRIMTWDELEGLLKGRIPVPPGKKPMEMAKDLIRGKRDWDFQPGFSSRPKIWEQVKKARSVGDMRRVAYGLREWGCPPAYAWRLFHSCAVHLLRAKKLPQYPKGGWNSSDDKRLRFFAKVLAGLEHGIAPATATKRLARPPFAKRVRLIARELAQQNPGVAPEAATELARTLAGMGLPSSKELISHLEVARTVLGRRFVEELSNMSQRAQREWKQRLKVREKNNESGRLLNSPGRHGPHAAQENWRNKPGRHRREQGE